MIYPLNVIINTTPAIASIDVFIDLELTTNVLILLYVSLLCEKILNGGHI